MLKNEKTYLESSLVTRSVGKEISGSVGIIGCGWLGTALANQLQHFGVDVLATRSNVENVEQLKNHDIHAEVLTLPAESELLNKHVIFKQQSLVIAITPQFRQGRLDYPEKIKQLVDAAKVSGKVKQIILLSSSAVYNGLSGQVDESLALDFSADKVLLLHQAEQAVLSFNNDKPLHFNLNASQVNSTKNRGYVLRLAGLVGPSRHPGKFLLNGRMLKSPQAIVNLIHQTDAVGLIREILTSDIEGDIFNGVSSTQVTKKLYYQTAAKSLGLATPVFEEDPMALDAKPKIVSGIKTQTLLNYSFVHADLLAWLAQVD